MKLEAATHEVVLSNVGATGEFRIRNSAKAFSILSSGLYSNKIRAIVRELSCNAVDSHVGAGKADVPFEVHLPTVLEPWFAVRDFGLGLDNDQVVNIYTTYFESTKTDSNEFIGALGLGSKSPFSYTENFTVTAIKNGIQRIYSAFINESGVPSIAMMGEQLTDEGNGVEVKFSVTDRGDYHTFRHEAQAVFQWFALQPTIIGNPLVIRPAEYKEKNVVPGVHARGDSNYSMALMGNISYPLNNVPHPEKHFGELCRLLECGLILEFGIGELDFAASREELSYIPLTIASIKKKLELLNANLVTHLTAQADAITHPWERAHFLYKQSETILYKNAVIAYVANTKFELYDPKAYHGKKTFELIIKDLADRNMTILGMHCRMGMSNKTGTTSRFINNAYVPIFNIPVDSSIVIVLNDLKTGIQARARYHYTRSGPNKTVICVSHSDPDLAVRQVEYDKLMAELHNPPTIVKASELDKEVRKKTVSSSGISHIRMKANCQEGYAASYTWSTHADKIDDNKIYYYVPIVGQKAINDKDEEYDFGMVKATMDMCGVKKIEEIVVHGVRRNRLKEILELDNWIHIDVKLAEEAVKITDADVARLVVAEMLDSHYNKVYTNGAVAKLVGPTSDYAKYFEKYGKLTRLSGNPTHLMTLCSRYGKSVEVDKVKKEIDDTRVALYKKYPLLAHCGQAKEWHVAEYIMMVDKQENT